jgi:hypothetical protein
MVFVSWEKRAISANFHSGDPRHLDCLTVGGM